MATDTARTRLELASGRNEITAPIFQTAQRRREKPLEPDTASVNAPPILQTIVEVPLAPMSAPADDPEVRHAKGGRTPWIAFTLAVLSVGFAVWWIMAQRIPDIDPRDVIARNLNEARIAMADGRYTDPPERSAFHYFSTVLALDPANADAISGIDAIADRHLTNARLLLSRGRIAEAGVALEKARRVRPDDDGLAALDTLWRAELRKLLAAESEATTASTVAIEEPQVTKPAVASIPKPVTAANVVASTPVPKVADVSALTAALAADQTPALVQAADVVAAVATVPAPQPKPAITAPAPIVEPKLIKIVQPRYPHDALLRGIEGWVDVSLQVTASGDVIEPRVEESNRGRLFNKAALTAVEQWKYEPRSDGGTSERIRVRLKFQRSH